MGISICIINDSNNCEHLIVFLSNHNVKSTNKHQIFISGEVHGDEKVGPTASIELLMLFMRNISNPWIKYLLDTRYIVIVPMVNPYGYEKVFRV